MTESRRRRGGLELNDSERIAIGNALSGANKKFRPMQRKLRRWEHHDLSLLFFLFLCLGLVILVYAIRYRYQEASKYPSLAGVSHEFRKSYQDSRQRVLPAYKDLYDKIYMLATERLQPPDETLWPEYERYSYEIKATYGATVQQCPITIVVLDTKLGKPVYDYGPGQFLWFELESIGAFAPDACIVLQTTTCAMKEYLGKDSSDVAAEQEVVKVIYDSSMPMFRRLIESGRVRIAFLNPQEYNLQSCRDLDNPSVVFMNRKYWDKEFLSLDSDMVLIHQEGASLCYPLTDLERLRSTALVGSLWPRDTTPLITEPLEGACRGMPLRWKTWLRPQRRWEMQQSDPKLAARSHPAPKPRQLLSEDFPAVCHHGRGPVGYGGFSLRSRKWMTQAIETCPHITHSGLKVEEEPYACKVFEEVSHDLYFATVFVGIGAPLPTAQEASLFATQVLWPEQAWDMYGFSTDAGTAKASRPTIRVDGQETTIPNVLINPWRYHPNEILRSEVMNHACPFLLYTFTPDMCRYEDSPKQAQPQWVGIGH